MAVTTVRAAQNTYMANVAGGTRVAENVDTDLGPFMDALEEHDTSFLDATRRGGAVDQFRHEWARKHINPRGSILGAGILAAATTITLPTGHGVRFQQGHVLKITNAAGTASEIVWVTDDPALSSLTVKRAQGGTTAQAFAGGDTISMIGIAMPQNSDFPLHPVTRGRRFFNYPQEFSGHLAGSSQHRYTGDLENDNFYASDMADLGADLKKELNEALLHGRRQIGSPDPADNTPSMLGGIFQFAELAGNVYDLAGAALTVENVDTVMVDRHMAVGRNAPKRLLMSLRTKQIVNRLAHPIKYQAGQDGRSADMRFDRITTETGTYEFEWMLGIPDGVILAYNTDGFEYNPYANLGWKEKEVPTKGNHFWRGMSGTFTATADGADAFAIIRNFSTTLSAYPVWGRPAA